MQPFIAHVKVQMEFTCLDSIGSTSNGQNCDITRLELSVRVSVKICVKASDVTGVHIR